MKNFHVSVLLNEVIKFLDVKKGKKYIDATLGGGGHTFEILKQGGKVLGIDLDQEAIDYVKENMKYLASLRSGQTSNIEIGEQLILTQGNFKDIDEIALLKGFEKVSGIIFDLGVSSYQLENKERGFSFQKPGPLDMRMNKSFSVKAADLVNALSKKELYELFIKLGEENNAFAISNGIVRARKIKPIETTDELAEIIKKNYKGNLKINPSTRVFQALRIAVNDELNNLREALPKALGLLEKNGLLLVISFHSLEDRIVKNSFINFEKEGYGTNVVKKPITPSFLEEEENPRSRSAKLRIFKKAI